MKIEMRFDVRLTVTEEGLTGLIKLSTGDMRKALNILQACTLLPHITISVLYNSAVDIDGIPGHRRNFRVCVHREAARE